MDYDEGFFDGFQPGDPITVDYRDRLKPEKVLRERFYFSGVSDSEEGKVVIVCRTLESGVLNRDKFIPRDNWKEDRNYIPLRVSDVVSFRRDSKDVERDDEDVMRDMLLPEGFDMDGSGIDDSSGKGGK